MSQTGNVLGLQFSFIHFFGRLKCFIVLFTTQNAWFKNLKCRTLSIYFSNI